MNKIINILIALLLCVIAFCGYNIYSNYTQEQKEIAENSATINDFMDKWANKDKIDIGQDTPFGDVEEEVREEVKKPDLAVGVIKIPSLNVEAPLAQGLDKYTLRNYVGIYDTTDPLGTIGGNTGIASHSAVQLCWYCWFDNIEFLEYGAKIYIYYEDGYCYEYEVIEVHAYADKYSTYAYEKIEGESLITLVTCSDGLDIDRDFVIAKLVAKY